MAYIRLMHHNTISRLALSIFALTVLGCASAQAQLSKVKHVVVIYMENHSFDNLWGQFPGADGLRQAKQENIIQLDAGGQPYTVLPPVPHSSAFPVNLPNNVFDIDQYVAADQVSPDVTHRFYQEQLQIDGGKMDKYALYNETKGFTMGYYKTA